MQSLNKCRQRCSIQHMHTYDNTASTHKHHKWLSISSESTSTSALQGSDLSTLLLKESSTKTKNWIHIFPLGMPSGSLM